MVCVPGTKRHRREAVYTDCLIRAASAFVLSINTCSSAKSRATTISNRQKFTVQLRMPPGREEDLTRGDKIVFAPTRAYPRARRELLKEAIEPIPPSPLHPKPPQINQIQIIIIIIIYNVAYKCSIC